MDILRKELNSIYEAQNLCAEMLNAEVVSKNLERISVCSEVDGDCRVITDASSDTCWVFGSRFGHLLGISPGIST